MTSNLASVAFGEEQHVHFGPGTIVDVIAGKRFTISADSFFQTNTSQAERLFELTARAAAVGQDDVLFDLYCGAGTIGLTVGQAAGRVVGFESVPSAVRDARLNARAAGAENAHFIEGDVLKELALFSEQISPDVVILDPRAPGCTPRSPHRCWP